MASAVSTGNASDKCSNHNDHPRGSTTRRSVPLKKTNDKIQMRDFTKREDTRLDWSKKQ